MDEEPNSAGNARDGNARDMAERRSTSRVAKVHLVQVNRFDEEGARADLTTGRTLNISRGGVRLELHHPLPLRSVVSLDLILGERILDVEGTVVYLEDLDGQRCGVGIKFRDLHPETEALIEAFVESFEAAGEGMEP